MTFDRFMEILFYSGIVYSIVFVVVILAVIGINAPFVLLGILALLVIIVITGYIVERVVNRKGRTK